LLFILGEGDAVPDFLLSNILCVVVVVYGFLELAVCFVFFPCVFFRWVIFF